MRFSVEVIRKKGSHHFTEMPDLADAYRGWIAEAIGAEGKVRDGKWSERIAVGSESFVMMTKDKMRIKAKGRECMVGMEAMSSGAGNPQPLTMAFCGMKMML